MRRERISKRKAQEKYYGISKGNDGLVLRVALSGEKSEKYRDDFAREDDMPDYRGEICPNALEFMHFEEENNAEV